MERPRAADSPTVGAVSTGVIATGVVTPGVTTGIATGAMAAKGAVSTAGDASGSAGCGSGAAIGIGGVIEGGLGGRRKMIELSATVDLRARERLGGASLGFLASPLLAGGSVEVSGILVICKQRGQRSLRPAYC